MSLSEIWLFLQQGVLSGLVTGSVYALLALAIVAIFVVSMVVMVLLYLMFNKTRIGKAMRAVGMNPRAAQIVGIRLSRIRMLVWAMSGVISALAALLITPKVLITPDIAHIAILAYAAAIVGGFTSLPSASTTKTISRFTT